jgi:hypothetical protein
MTAVLTRHADMSIAREYGLRLFTRFVTIANPNLLKKNVHPDDDKRTALRSVFVEWLDSNVDAGDEKYVNMLRGAAYTVVGVQKTPNYYPPARRNAFLLHVQRHAPELVRGYLAEFERRAGYTLEEAYEQWSLAGAFWLANVATPAVQPFIQPFSELFTPHFPAPDWATAETNDDVRPPLMFAAFVAHGLTSPPMTHTMVQAKPTSVVNWNRFLAYLPPAFVAAYNEMMLTAYETGHSYSEKTRIDAIQETLQRDLYQKLNAAVTTMTWTREVRETDPERAFRLKVELLGSGLEALAKQVTTWTPRAEFESEVDELASKKWRAFVPLFIPDTETEKKP